MTEILKLIIPVIAVLLGSYMTYSFTVRSRRDELLFSKKVEAYVLLASMLQEIKNNCEGEICEIRGIEGSPYKNTKGLLKLSSELTNIKVNIIFFLSYNVKHSIDNFLQKLYDGNNIAIMHQLDSIPEVNDDVYIETLNSIVKRCKLIQDDMYNELAHKEDE
ncbi:hypothetical protein [Elizabethkingia anophelis]|uniref:hypothetical protein n=1 Tax=Elizabethkingia anophelis TaxID=1117645 RepID=UPI000C6EBB36|nr:hypothetical protein [Elizabethkingia anophelis]PKR32165.1 hypothetical protein CWH99_15845 [Elizabethkingia anophelis]PKR33251.1 hypothetical protein CWI00_18535 [Elizabethkingia anophelis]PRQ78793.1 hypothetical protein CMT60_15795 [Elizabethkingia anophelis]PRQ86590.1 hypothetical protein CMT87_01265 [Elizabethkingia anophelis]PRQ88097.1 hypothetical protein CMT86_06335 [Elizabethkingia anophelis]